MNLNSVSFNSGISPYSSNSYDNRNAGASINASPSQSSGGPVDAAALSPEAKASGGNSADGMSSLLSGLDQNYGDASGGAAPAAPSSSGSAAGGGDSSSAIAESSTAIQESTEQMVESQADEFIDILQA